MNKVIEISIESEGDSDFVCVSGGPLECYGQSEFIYQQSELSDAESMAEEWQHEAKTSGFGDYKVVNNAR